MAQACLGERGWNCICRRNVKSRQLEVIPVKSCERNGGNGLLDVLIGSAVNSFHEAVQRHDKFVEV